MNEWLARNQHKIAIFIGYILVFLLAFGLGKISVSMPNPPEIKVEDQSFVPQVNDTASVQGLQSTSPTASGGTGGPAGVGDCAGKIKGNIGSSGKIYHLPGGAFYDRTNPEMCFDTEKDAQAAGFRKSIR